MSCTADSDRYKWHPFSGQRKRLTSTNLQLSDSNKHPVLGTRWSLTQKLFGRLTVRRNVALSLTEFGWLVSDWRGREWLDWARDPAVSLPIRREWLVAVRPLPLVEEEAPFQNTRRSEKNTYTVVGPDGVKYQEGRYWGASAAIYWTGR
jgi:hypothetical protein